MTRYCIKCGQSEATCLCYTGVTVYPVNPPQRVEISRSEYERMIGRKTDQWTIGAVWYGANSVPLIEYLFVEEPIGDEVQWLKRLLSLD